MLHVLGLPGNWYTVGWYTVGAVGGRVALPATKAAGRLLQAGATTRGLTCCSPLRSLRGGQPSEAFSSRHPQARARFRDCRRCASMVVGAMAV
jgi:hypothetical protein